MNNILCKIVLCLAGLALFAMPGLAQTSRPADGPALKEQPTPRELALERQVRQLQRQVNELSAAINQKDSADQPRGQRQFHGQEDADRDDRPAAGDDRFGRDGGNRHAMARRAMERFDRQEGFADLPDGVMSGPMACPMGEGPQSFDRPFGITRHGGPQAFAGGREAFPASNQAEARWLLLEAQRLIDRAEMLMDRSDADGRQPMRSAPTLRRDAGDREDGAPGKSEGRRGDSRRPAPQSDDDDGPQGPR